MKTVTLHALLVLFAASTLFASMLSSTIIVEVGKSVDLVSLVQWPAITATAKLAPPAKVNGDVTGEVSFQQNSKVIVEGPTTITLEYGTPDIPVATEAETSTPDAIGN